MTAITDQALMERVVSAAESADDEYKRQCDEMPLHRGPRPEDRYEMIALRVLAALRESGRLVDDDGIAAIAQERQQQISVEGGAPEHDDCYECGEMSQAAGCYAIGSSLPGCHDGLFKRYWPWETSWWKPKNPLRDLERAGALIAAEISRLHRKAAPPAPAATEEH